MQEFEFTANTPAGERRTTVVGVAVLVGVALLMFVIFDVLLPGLLPSRAVFWAVVVVPSVIAFLIVVRRMQHLSLGMYMLRLDGRHLTLVRPDQTVMDLGEVQHVATKRFKDGKGVDFGISGSKDDCNLRLRTAAAWNGHSRERDFRTLAKASAAIDEALFDRGL